jgi:hypothetical protein
LQNPAGRRLSRTVCIDEKLEPWQNDAPKTSSMTLVSLLEGITLVQRSYKYEACDQASDYDGAGANDF